MKEIEIERVKIKTNKGRIITLLVTNRDNTHIRGTDKFGVPTIVPMKEIDSMYAVTDGDKNECS